MLGFETMSNGGGFSHDYCLILMQGLQVASVCQSSTAALMGSGVALYLCQVPSLSLARCTWDWLLLPRDLKRPARPGGFCSTSRSCVLLPLWWCAVDSGCLEGRLTNCLIG